MSRIKAVSRTVYALVLIVALIVVAIAGITYYVTLPKGEEEILIGVILPLTGPWAWEGLESRTGIELAVEEINDAGGIKSLGGAKLRVVVFDSGESSATASAAASRLLGIYGDKLVAGIGAWASGLTIAASEITEREKLPFFSISWSDVYTDRGYDYVFRVVSNGTTLGGVWVKGVLDLFEAGGKSFDSICIVRDDNPAQLYVMNAVVNGLADEGIETVFEEVWTPPLVDATPIVTRIKNANPDLIVMGFSASGDGVLLLSKMQELGVTIPIFHTGAGSIMTPYFKDIMGDSIEGMLGGSDWNLLKGQEDMEQFVTEHTGENYVVKDLGLHYGILKIIAETLEATGSTDPDEICQYVRTHDIPTSLYGTIRFRENGGREDGEGLGVIFQWQGPKPVTVWPAEHAEGDVIW